MRLEVLRAEEPGREGRRGGSHQFPVLLSEAGGQRVHV